MYIFKYWRNSLKIYTIFTHRSLIYYVNHCANIHSPARVCNNNITTEERRSRAFSPPCKHPAHTYSHPAAPVGSTNHLASIVALPGAKNIAPGNFKHLQPWWTSWWMTCLTSPSSLRRGWRGSPKWIAMGTPKKSTSRSPARYASSTWRDHAWKGPNACIDTLGMRGLWCASIGWEDCARREICVNSCMNMT